MMKGWLLTDPFAEIRFHKEPVERDFLEKAELKKLLDKPLDIPRLAQVRDISDLAGADLDEGDAQRQQRVQTVRLI